MALSESNQRHLAVLRDIYEVSRLCSTTTYIWAGLVPDILTGVFLRDHGDVDGFTLNLWALKGELAARYRQRGYAITLLDEVDFLRIDRDGVQATFNQLEFEGETALWRHAGREGTVYFPRCWLPAAPMDFYDAKVFVSGLEFEYAIKTHPHLLNPEWQGRDKDREAIDWLSKRLAERQIDCEEILKQIWGYNPYWVKRGYPEYARPAVAWPLAPRG